MQPAVLKGVPVFLPLIPVIPEYWQTAITLSIAILLTSGDKTDIAEKSLTY